MSGAALGADARIPVYKAPPLPPVSVWSRYYVGAAVNWVHHTGYVPESSWSAERYGFGGKVFGGYRFTETISFEAAYHYLGKVSFYEGSPILSDERSYAVSGSAVFLSPALSTWVGPTSLPIHGFVRLGLAYKDITHWSVAGTFHEGVLSGVLGAGFEFRPTANVFVRLEYEFLSTAIGGPSRPVPILNSLTTAHFGGTERAINVMHTPLALTLGVNL
jgi:opacity protein-like surface antigen